jgi:actin-like ATPase involved in cell morphogenesis
MATGVDIGTAFLVSATQDESGQTQVKSVRDAFLDIEADASVLNMLKMSNVSYVQDGNSVYVVGEPALSIANLLKREARRPMSQGVISPGEHDAERMLVILLKSILKGPRGESENVFYSVPAKSIDREMDVVYHQEMFRKIIESFGYKATPMNEAAAIVYSNCSKEGFTALATSFGAGSVNTALVYQTMVGMAFSLARSGDWVDSSAARAVGSTATRLMAVKEKGVNLLDPNEGDPKQVREREAIVMYYRNLIRYVIENVSKEFKRDNSKIELPESIVWVLSGGTTKPKNFLEFFKQEFEKERSSFPINISDIRMATDPLNAVAQGLLIAAMNE